MGPLWRLRQFARPCNATPGTADRPSFYFRQVGNSVYLCRALSSRGENTIDVDKAVLPTGLWFSSTSPQSRSPAFWWLGGNRYGFIGWIRCSRRPCRAIRYGDSSRYGRILKLASSGGCPCRQPCSSLTPPAPKADLADGVYTFRRSSGPTKA